MTRQEKNKLIEYLIKHEYNKLDTLPSTEIYSREELLWKSVSGFDVYAYTRIIFYSFIGNGYGCLLDTNIHEKDDSTIYGMMSIQKTIESVESFIEFEKVIPLASKFCNDHLFKSCEDGKESRTELL